MVCSFSAFHTRAVSSALPVTSRVASGLNAERRTQYRPLVSVELGDDAFGGQIPNERVMRAASGE
jgi:hypothetical protein